MEICLITRDEIWTYSVKDNFSCYHFNTLLLRTLMSMYFIISNHPCHYLCIHDILLHAHAYSIVRRDNPFGVQRTRRGGSVGDALGHSSKRRGANSRGPPWVPGSPANLFPQRQAPEHSKSLMFYKILLESFMFDALGYKSWIETTWCIELPCLHIYTFNSM